MKSGIIASLLLFLTATAQAVTFLGPTSTTLPAGTTVSIEWMVKETEESTWVIEYSTNRGKTWDLITTTQCASVDQSFRGQFDWYVDPQLLGTLIGGESGIPIDIKISGCNDPGNIARQRFGLIYPPRDPIWIESNFCVVSDSGDPLCNFELVVHEGDQLCHYWRDNGDPDLQWHKSECFGSNIGSNPGFIQSTLGNQGNFEVVVREDDQLCHYWRDNDKPPGFPWHKSECFGSNIDSAPSLIQAKSGSNNRNQGNFEVVVRGEDNLLCHYWRDNNKPPGYPWTKTGCFANEPPRYLSEDFESENWRKRYYAVDSGESAFKNVLRKAGVGRNGSYGIVMTARKGEHWGGRIVFDHRGRGQEGIKEIWTRYYIRFGPNWKRDDREWKPDNETGRGGKAGFRARGHELCKDAPCLEMTDSFHFLDKGFGPIWGRSYWHHNVPIFPPEKIDQGFDFKGRFWIKPEGLREREQWYCVESHHVLNTPGKDDGVYQNWLDGTLVSDKRTARQQAADEKFNIDQSVLITYIGGDWGADREMNVYFDDWAVSDKRIGCLTVR